jgi:hypothetical protein
MPGASADNVSMNDDEYANFLRQEIAQAKAADEPLRRAAAETVDAAHWRLTSWPAPTHRQPNRVHLAKHA